MRSEAVTVPAAPNAQPKKNKRHLSAHASENLAGYLFILPNLVGFLVFTLFGIIFSLVMSFTDFNLIKGIENAKFVGLQNFKAMFTDTYLAASLRNNAILLIAVPITIFLAALLASVINYFVYWKGGARALYFLPYVTNIVAVSTIWQALLHASKGPVNMFLKSIGVPADDLPGWFASSKWALVAVIIILIWQTVGFDILMYSSALQSIPQDYYEAAKIDGAGPVARFFRITLPMLRPTTFLLTVLGIISSLQMWQLVKILTKGGPGTATYTLSLYIYRSAFETYRAGYACALSWLLCLIIFVFTAIRWRTEKKWSVD